MLLKEEKSWVLFENGTCLIILEPEDDLRAQAIEIMKMWDSVVPGTSAGDFKVDIWEDRPGWTVFYHHPDMANYVSPEEFEEESEDQVRNDMIIGLIGRNKRSEDAKTLKIVHVEDKRI